MNPLDDLNADDARQSETLSAESEQALAVLSRCLDGEPVEPSEEARARSRLDSDPALAAAWRDMGSAQAALAALPGLTASAGFADRVVAAAAAAAPTHEPAPILPFVRRLAVAAAVTLGVTVGGGLARPLVAAADASIEQAWHAVDHFRSSPYAADDLARGIHSLLRSPDPTSPPPIPDPALDAAPAAEVPR